MPGASEWLRRAREDVAVARLTMDAGFYEAATFHLQQALEKGLKYLILSSGHRVANIHDLERLSEQAADPQLPFNKEELAQISLWAIGARYPDDDDPPPQLARLD